MTRDSWLRDQAGAVAVVTAILAVVLIGVAAVAVDLGNAFARKRLVQTQADLAALAGAALLDGTAASAAPARTEVLAYLGSNDVFGGATFDAATMDNDNLADGEIDVIEGFTKVKVTAPPATVDYGLAGVFEKSSLDVQAVAVAGIFSPGAIAPFFIAEGCLVSGGSRLEIKTDPGNVTPTPITPAFFDAPANPNKTWPALTGAPTPFEVLPNTPGQQVTVPGTNLSNLEEVGLVWGETAADRTTIPAGSFTVTPGAKPKDPDLVTFIVPDLAVTMPAAPFDQTRVLFLQVRRAGETMWSAANPEASISVPLPGADIPDECGEKSTGDFGLLDSPRDGVKNLEASQQNIAEGMDHPVYSYPGGTAALDAQGIPAGQTDGAKWNDICVKYTASPVFVLDEPGAVNPNCLEIYTGNKVPALDAGLIEGGTSPDFDGRLDAPASPLCGRTRTVTLNATWLINDDLLSCFIKDNRPLSDVLTPAATDLLDPALIDSPRFLIVPVIHAAYPPANGSYPIVDFRGAMISAEQITSRASSPKPEPDNGVTISNKKIGSMTVTYFELTALPEVVSTTGKVITYIGTGPRVVRLVQ